MKSNIYMSRKTLYEHKTFHLNLKMGCFPGELKWNVAWNGQLLEMIYTLDLIPYSNSLPLSLRKIGKFSGMICPMIFVEMG